MPFWRQNPVRNRDLVRNQAFLVKDNGCRRDSIKHLGRIPVVIHTDHANIARLEALPLERVDSKHYRWLSELLQGGSLLLHRPGAGVLHRAPDGLSRNLERRDHLILARAGEWKDQRDRIRGVCRSIKQGDFDDEEPEVVEIASVPKQQLIPIPGASSRVKDETSEKIKEAVEAKKARLRQKKESEENDETEVAAAMVEAPRWVSLPPSSAEESGGLRGLPEVAGKGGFQGLPASECESGKARAGVAACAAAFDELGDTLA